MRRALVSWLMVGLCPMAHAQGLPPVQLPAALSGHSAPAGAKAAPTGESTSALNSALKTSLSEPVKPSTGLQWKSGFSVVGQAGFSAVPQPLQTLTGRRLHPRAMNVLAHFSAGNGGALGLDSTVQLRWAKEGGQSQGWHAKLRRARLVHTGRVTLEGGYDHTGWSFFDLFHPLDPNPSHAFRIDPQDWSTNHADPFVRASLAWAGGRFTAMLGSQSDRLKSIRADNLFGALRYERPWGSGRLSGQWIHDPRLGNRIGLGADVETGSTIWVAEWEMARHRDLPHLSANGFGELPRGAHQRWVLGMRQALGSGSQLDLGYHHNQHGLRGNEWRQWNDANTNAAWRLERGDPTGLGMLAASSELARSAALRRNYLFGSWVSGDRLQPFEITLGSYYGLDDRSGLAFFEVKRTLNEKWAIRMSGSKSFGSSRTEFGQKPSQINLQLHLKI